MTSPAEIAAWLSGMSELGCVRSVLRAKHHEILEPTEFGQIEGWQVGCNANSNLAKVRVGRSIRVARSNLLPINTTA